MKFRTTRQFDKDYKRCKKRGLNMKPLTDVLRILVAGETLPSKYKDHALVGQYIGCRECHIKPDWLLVYQYDYENDEI
ncbi:MAG: type II toxin-antitoxin system YafQ family toxin, partial [Abditibacteriota bacterium]|nr:type II toxin-antitoxin system YafQ family toxin [Abditibacteriota bacterium]